MRRFCGAWLSAICLGCGTSPTSPGTTATGLSPVAPSADWPASTPQAQGLNAGILTDLANRIRRGDYGPVSSLLIARHQQLVVEEYFRGWSAERVHTMQSVTKSVTSLLTGIAVNRGRLSIDAPVTSFFPGYAPIANLDDRKRAMTVRDLLMMQTGLDWSEATIAGSPLDQLNRCGCDWLRFVLEWPMREPPGTRWEYVSGGTIVLGGIVGVATGQRIDQFAAAQLFGPLGITNTYWIGGLPDGLPHSGGGLGLRPRDMLKVGQLVLDGGRWRGAQIVSEGWIRESTAPLVRTSAFGPGPADYGYLWWRLPNDVITASGAQGQWIFILPAADLVMATTGESDADYFGGRDFLYSHVLTSVTDRWSYDRYDSYDRYVRSVERACASHLFFKPKEAHEIQLSLDLTYRSYLSHQSYLAYTSSAMPLPVGSRVGPYEIVAKLGAGGMGEVYRAHDAKLNRDVAIKVLPDLFATDPERLARLTREAQTLAALNHANIAHIYGVEGHALVMELVEGEDLAEHIARGPIPLAEALPMARQIANALEAAHDQGIIHRDLKPANIKVKSDGTVKVLDFGLAKALTDDSGLRTEDVSNSPTLTARATQMGMIIGTAAYMSPEQARGKSVDRRADIWAFGLVLYEMLTGRRAFEGQEISDVLAAVLRQDIDWTPLPAGTPSSVRRLLRRCLEKDPRKRLNAIGDARLELDEPEPVTPGSASPAPPARPSIAARLWPAIAGMVFTAAVAALLWPKPTAVAPDGLSRLAILPPPGEELYPDSTGVAISPDGTMVAFIVGSVNQSISQLWVRSLDSSIARKLDDSEGALLPFWSPDGRRIGYFTSRKLKTIAVTGGRSETLADAPNGRGATWNAANVILFAPEATGPIFRIPATGGTPEPVTTVDSAKKEYGHRFPLFLPDGDHFLFASLPGKAGKFDISVGSLKDKSRTHVGALESSPAYADPGWLLFVRQGVLAAQAFDVNTKTLKGDPHPLEDEPTSILNPAVSFTANRAVSVSLTGALAFYSTPSLNTTATWYDASGKTAGTVDVPGGHYETATISPDGTRAIFVRSTSPSESTLWLINLARGGAIPLSTGPGRNDSPVWSPDGKRVAFASDRDGPQNFYVKTVDDATPEQLLYASDVLFKNPAYWSSDGQWMVVTQLEAGMAQDTWLMPASGKGELKPLVRGPSRDNAGPISPDGKWLAFSSDETGRFEVYVQAFPDPGARTQVSQQGGAGEWWTRDSRQIVFAGADFRSLWRADLEPGKELHVSPPKQFATLPATTIWVDASPDRQRFLVLAPERTGIGSVTVVQHWLADLKRAAK